MVAGAFVVVGRLERRHEQDAMLNGIASVRAAIGPSLAKPGPDDYILLNPGRTCLLWAVGARTYALELCIDGQGRVVEAVDRQWTQPHFYSIIEEPNVARLRISPALFALLVARVEHRYG